MRLPLGRSEDPALQERSVKHAEEEAMNAPSHLKVGALTVRTMVD